MEENRRIKNLFYEGFNDKLVWIFIACAIWGFFPVFYTEEIIRIADGFSALFLVLRYLVAVFFFFLIYLGFVFAGYFRMTDILYCYRKYRMNFLFMGIILFAARRFEIKGYMGGDPVYTTFSIIYSVFFVIIWDIKSWVFRKAAASFKFIEKSDNMLLRSLGKSFFSAAPDVIEFMLWAVQCLLVICSGFFILQFMNGALPVDFGSLFFIFSDKSGMTAGPVLWCLASAFCLSLFFDQISFLKDIEKPSGLLENLKFAINSQFCIAGSFLAVSSIDMFLGQKLENLPDVADIFNMSFCINLFAIGFMGTCVAYISEAAGAAMYDIEQESYGNLRITGREWLSVSANFDPLISAFVVLFMGQNASSAGWVSLPVICILGVIFLSFVKLWNQKMSVSQTPVYVKQKLPVLASVAVFDAVRKKQ